MRQLIIGLLFLHLLLPLNRAHALSESVLAGLAIFGSFLLQELKAEVQGCAGDRDKRVSWWNCLTGTCSCCKHTCAPCIFGRSNEKIEAFINSLELSATQTRQIKELIQHLIQSGVTYDASEENVLRLLITLPPELREPFPDHTETLYVELWSNSTRRISAEMTGRLDTQEQAKAFQEQIKRIFTGLSPERATQGKLQTDIKRWTQDEQVRPLRENPEKGFRLPQHVANSGAVFFAFGAPVGSFEYRAPLMMSLFPLTGQESETVPLEKMWAIQSSDPTFSKLPNFLREYYTDIVPKLRNKVESQETITQQPRSILKWHDLVSRVQRATTETDPESAPPLPLRRTRVNDDEVATGPREAAL